MDYVRCNTSHDASLLFCVGTVDVGTGVVPYVLCKDSGLVRDFLISAVTFSEILGQVADESKESSIPR